MSEEVEKVEVKYTGGVGWFFFGAIPALLAGAALMWLAFYTGVIDLQKMQRIEARMDGRVGVHGELKAPVDLIIRDTGCLHVSRAFLDDATLTAYLTDSCHKDMEYWEVHWNGVSPDHTIIHSGYSNNVGGGSGIAADSTLEVTFDLSRDEDTRTSKIIVWSTGH